MFAKVSTPQKPGAVRKAFLFLLVFAATLAALAPSPARADWPEIPASEWKLTSVPEAPNAPAVVLHREGHLVFTERAVSSYLEVYQRTKILSEEGLDFGSISLPSSRFYRMKNLEARTLQPDGKVTPIGKEDTFEKKFSVYYKFQTHSLAMPEVKVGSIIEFRYKIFFDSFRYTVPWYFQDQLPVMRSEIVCEFPTNIGMQPYRVVTVRREMEESAERSPIGHRITYGLSNLPPVPDEPSSFPFEDLSSRVVFLTQAVVLSGQRIPVLDSWKSVIESYQDYVYKDFRSGSRACRKMGSSLAAGKKNPREAVATILQYVQQEIATEPFLLIETFEDRSCDKVLKERRGSNAEKAVMLEQMLKGAKIDSSLGWTASRFSGRVVQQVPQPSQLDRVLVVVELEGQRVFLDAASLDTPLGHLQPGLEGVPVLLLTKKGGEWVTTSKTPSGESSRTATLDLEITDDGAVVGSGKLLLRGHHAWNRIHWKENQEETQKAWEEWLGNRFDSFDVSEITVEERGQALEVEVAWKLAQREDEVLGDEVSVRPAMVLGLTENRFNLPPEQRQTPVMMYFADIENVELSLRWPADWEVEAQPKLRAVDNGAGRLETEMVVESGARRLVAKRSFEVYNEEYVGLAAYRQLHQLYEEALANDAEQVVLVLN